MGLSDGSNFSRLKPESPDRPVVLLDGTDAGRRSEVSMMGDECIGGGVSDGMTHTILQVRKKFLLRYSNTNYLHKFLNRFISYWLTLYTLTADITHFVVR